MKWIDKIPLLSLTIIALALGFSPFVPEPHLWQKLKMLTEGTLVRPLDIFDLVFHAAGPMLLTIKLLRISMIARERR